MLLLSFSLLFYHTSFLYGQPTSLRLETLRSAKQARSEAGTRVDQELLWALALSQKKLGIPTSPLVTASELAVPRDSTIWLYDEMGRIGVRIRCESVAKMLENLADLGFKESGRREDLGMIEGFLPVLAIDRLDRLQSQGLLSAGVIFHPVKNIGSVGTQADTVMSSYRVRNLVPDLFSGEGISIGVMSDSYNHLGGAANGVASGDLPTDVRVLDEFFMGGDEGRAMIELIHDIAPGSDKYFATAFRGEFGFANNIQQLADSGCQVIVDDVAYLTEPFFQDGILSQKINEVSQFQGVLYFSSAGNQGVAAYERVSPAFSVDPLSAEVAHDFIPSSGVDHYQGFQLSPGQRILMVMQWDDPLYTSNGVDTDLDLFLLSHPASAGNVLAFASNDNLVNQFPMEILNYENTSGSTQTVHLLITRPAGVTPSRFKYVNFGEHAPTEHQTNSPTMNPHAGAQEAIAVAAAPFWSRNTPEPFSSRGPSTLLFDPFGVALASPLVLPKPNLTAPDGCNNTFFGADSPADPDNFPNFFGTSAAAPQAAAVAALVWEAFPSESRNDIYLRLINTTQDIHTFGFDAFTGHGLIDAYRAIYPIVPASLPFVEDFEAVGIGAAWELLANGTGRIQVNSSSSPGSGIYHLSMDTWFPSAMGLNEAILHLDASATNELTLSFEQREAPDTDHVMPSSFTGSHNSDGVAMSVDGNQWYSLVSLTGANSSTTTTIHTVDLGAVAIAQGLTLGSDLRIKFQQYGLFPTPNDGMTFDQIQVYPTTSFPLQWISFTAEWNERQQAVLQWETAEERNNDYFRIERSLDGVSFQAIGQVASTVSEGAASYEYRDWSPHSGTNYYRIWQVDHDGTQQASQTVMLAQDEWMNAYLYPQPLSGTALQLVIPPSSGKEIGLVVMNMQGKEVFRQSQASQPGQHRLEVELPILAPGIYLLRVVTPEKSHLLRLSKQ